MARPPAPPTSSSRRGDRPNHDRAVLATRLQALSEASAIANDTRLSRIICTGTSPAWRLTNPGSIAANRMTALGLATPTTNPSSAARRPPRGASACANADTRPRRCRTARAPSHTRYRPPASFTAVNTRADRCTRVPTPSATQMATTSTPTALPRTEASAVRRPCASALPTTNSTLGPGITMRMSDARAKASN